MSQPTTRATRHAAHAPHASRLREAAPTARAAAVVEAEPAPRGGTLPASLLAGGEAHAPSADFSCTGAEGVVPAVARVEPVAVCAMAALAFLRLRLRRRGGR